MRTDTAADVEQGAAVTSIAGRRPIANFLDASVRYFVQAS